MTIKILKYYKSQSTKYLAVCMSICYILSPLQNHISAGLHHFFHSIEMPSFVLSHQHQNRNSEATHDDVHEHDNHITTHKHLFIDLVDDFFKASNENGKSDESPQDNFKIKKHLTFNTVSLSKKLRIIFASKIFTYQKKLCTGYYKPKDIPPKTDLPV